MENESFKLNTRRWLAWGLVGLGGITIAFLAIWGAIKGNMAMVTLGGGALIGEIGMVVGFYFGKKLSEE